jgi:hypothetical protein
VQNIFRPEFLRRIVVERAAVDYRVHRVLDSLTIEVVIARGYRYAAFSSVLRSKFQNEFQVRVRHFIFPPFLDFENFGSGYGDFRRGERHEVDDRLRRHSEVFGAGGAFYAAEGQAAIDGFVAVSFAGVKFESEPSRFDQNVSYFFVPPV